MAWGPFTTLQVAIGGYELAILVKSSIQSIYVQVVCEYTTVVYIAWVSSVGAVAMYFGSQEIRHQNNQSYNLIQ